MEYLKLFFYNRRLLTFGILLTFFSSFGKTFFIALYLKDFTREFSLSTTGFSLLYAIATILGGLLFIYFGRFADSSSLKKYTAWVVFGLSASCLVLALSHHFLFLFIGILGLRLTGQSLLPHISLTAMSQRFRRCRGKAISMAILGNPIGEAILPLISCYLIHFYSWRTSLIVSASIMACLVLPAVFLLLRRKIKTVDLKPDKPPLFKKKKKGKILWTAQKILSNRKFYFIAPSIVTLTFINAGILFFLVSIGKEKGWSETWIIHCFTAFGIGNFVSGLLTGSLIDRFRASGFFSFYLIPYAVGLFLVITFSSMYIALVFLALAGFTVGMANCVESSLMAEVYGTKCMGQVRSVYTSFGIFSAALGPLCFGLLHDHGIHFSVLLTTGILFIALSSLLSFKVRSASGKKSIRFSILKYRISA